MAATTRHSRQTELAFRTRGGKRPGAGRKPSAARVRRSERHRSRPAHNKRHPVHVTVRVTADLCSLRRRHIYEAVRRATVAAVAREDFRIVQLSIQSTHLHLLVEADDKEALSTGMQGFLVSAAKRINRAVSALRGQVRRGRVIDDRFHARALTSPRAVRNTLAYVLLNWRRHGEHRVDYARSWNVDLFSSGVTFRGWKELAPSFEQLSIPSNYTPLSTSPPRTWLLLHWSDFHPLISMFETPGRQ